MKDTPNLNNIQGESDTVTVELDRETAELLKDHSGIDAEIQIEASQSSENSQPKATTETLGDLLESIRDTDKREQITKGENHYIKHFLATKCSFGLSLTSVRNYVGILNEYARIVSTDDDDSFLRADRGDFNTYLRHLIQKGNRWETFKLKTNVVTQFYKHTDAEFPVSCGLNIAFFRRFDPSRYKTELPDPLERNPLEPDEMRKLVDSADSKRNKLMIRLLYQASLRNSEVRNLKIDQIDLDISNPMIKIMDSKFGKNRYAPLLQEMALDLEHWIDVERPSFSSYASESEYVFPSQRGCKLKNNSALQYCVDKAAKKAGLQKVIGKRADGSKKYRVDVHVLRHTGNTHWEKSGLDIEERMKLLGHEDKKTTENYSPDGTEASFEKLRDQFDPVV